MESDHANNKVPPNGTDLSPESATSFSQLQLEESIPVPVYGELVTSIQTPSLVGLQIEEGFEGTSVDLKKSPFPVKNDLFDGLVHIMLRDLTGNTYDFNGEKNVIWEIQIQGKFQRQIKGPIYYALELPQRERYKATAAIRLVIRGSMAVMKTMGHKEIHLSFGGGDELPHIAGPAFHSLDRVVVTPEGDKPPSLGEHLLQTTSDISRRKAFSKTGLELDLNATYTFSVKNRRFDALNWKVIGVPFVRSFDVSRFTEAARLALYEVVEENGKLVEDPKGKLTTLAKKKHTKRNTFLWVQMSRKNKYETTETPQTRRSWRLRK